MKSPTTKPNKPQFLSSCRSYNDLHILYSLLPKQYTLYPKTQFKKTKDFYRPEEFIWNNPHRSSERIYKYYHQGVEYYKKHMEPEITKKQQEDRDVREMTRILSLSKKREEDRVRFHSKKLERLSLQNKTGLRRNNSTLLYSTNNLSSELSKTSQAQYQHPPSLRRSNSESLKNPSKNNTKATIFNMKNTKKSEQMSLNQRFYLASVQNYDTKNKALMATIKQSQKEMKDKIRESFLKQKENNSLMNDSRQQQYTQGKLTKSTLNKKSSFNLNFTKLSKPRTGKTYFDCQRS